MSVSADKDIETWKPVRWMFWSEQQEFNS